MAIYRIFPEKDTFIYTESPLANTGRDELLEVGGYFTSGGGQTLRSLIKFNQTEINEVLNSKANVPNGVVGIGQHFSASLHLYLSFANELPINYNINVHPIAEEWDEGTGKISDVPVNRTGASWTNKLAGNNHAWTSGSVDILDNTAFTDANDLYQTASYQNTLPGGGSWYITSGSAAVPISGSETFTKNSSHDLDIDITTASTHHYNNHLDNNGFIVKLEDSLEFNTAANVRLKYYGEDTNTIYPPYMEIKWNDYSHNSTLTEVTDPEVVITVKNNKGKYTDEGKQRFRIHSRPKYPTRTFTTSSAYLVNHTLPTASYWGLKDENTEEMVFDYDTTFTKISADNTSNYFDIYMDGLQPERYYRLLIKTEIDGTTTIVDNDQIFKVVRNG